ncbi:MAG: tyrosine-type recombinase/integrase, partial [Flavitalea sp.]
MWEPVKKGFKAYLQLEKSLSENSVQAYLRDINKLTDYLQLSGKMQGPGETTLQDLQQFLQWIGELGMTAASQARIISGIRSFYSYCLMEQLTDKNPTLLLEAPRLKRKLPDVLSFAEIESVIRAIDLSKPEGERNKAILETLYSCGLRVSEIINLKLSNLYFDVGFIRVIGKGDKERLVPIGAAAAKQITTYIKNVRVHQRIQPGNEDIVFLNRRGAALTRVMIFIMLKE